MIWALQMDYITLFIFQIYLLYTFDRIACAEETSQFGKSTKRPRQNVIGLSLLTAGGV